MNLIERIGKRRAGFEIDMTNGPLLGKIVRFAIPPGAVRHFAAAVQRRGHRCGGPVRGPHRPGGRGLYQRGHQPDRQPVYGFSVGANVLAAQYYGAGKNKDLSETVHTAVLSSLAFGVALIFAGVAPVPAYAGA